MSNKNSQGIWEFHNLLPVIPEKFRVNKNEGDTPLVFFDNVYFKCEFRNPSGSVKDRGFAFQVAKLKELGIKNAVLSSSGNAAISASLYCTNSDINLHIFVSPNINRNKLEILKKLPVDVRFSHKPVSDAHKFSIAAKAYNLRPSRNIYGSIGFWTISFEIAKELPAVDAVFIPASSATMLRGIYEGFSKIGLSPAIHAVQSQAVNPICSYFDKMKTSNVSIADAIVARYVPNLDRITSIIKESKGSGWIISDKEMLDNHELLKNANLLCSYEGAAVYAAVKKARKKGYIYDNPICILSGKYYG